MHKRLCMRFRISLTYHSLTGTWRGNRRNRIRDKNKKLNKMIQYAVFMHEKDGIANCRLQWFGNNRLTIRGGKKQLVTPKAENIK